MEDAMDELKAALIEAFYLERICAWVTRLLEGARNGR